MLTILLGGCRCGSIVGTSCGQAWQGAEALGFVLGLP